MADFIICFILQIAKAERAGIQTVLRDTAARYPVIRLVLSPTTPHAAISAVMRAARSGDFSRASAAASSSPLTTTTSQE